MHVRNRLPTGSVQCRYAPRQSLRVTAQAWGQLPAARPGAPAGTRRDELMRKALCTAAITFTTAELLAALKHHARSPAQPQQRQQQHASSSTVQHQQPAAAAPTGTSSAKKNPTSHADIVLLARAYQLEYHHWQHEIEACVQHRDELLQDPALCRCTEAAKALASTTWEFCPLTSAVISDKEIEGLHKGLTQAIAEHSQLLASCMSKDGLVPGMITAAGVVTAEEPCPNEALVASKAAVKRARAEWERLQAEITHQQVRIWQARQLPAQPKRKITVTMVKQLQIDELWTHTAQLRGKTSELAAAIRGM